MSDPSETKGFSSRRPTPWGAISLFLASAGLLFILWWSASCRFGFRQEAHPKEWGVVSDYCASSELVTQTGFGAAMHTLLDPVSEMLLSWPRYGVVVLAMLLLVPMLLGLYPLLVRYRALFPTAIATGTVLITAMIWLRYFYEDQYRIHALRFLQTNVEIPRSGMEWKGLPEIITSHSHGGLFAVEFWAVIALIGVICFVMPIAARIERRRVLLRTGQQGRVCDEVDD